ncbi:hypothetical protein DL95DRAFT_267896, partial [Leptodontidium sp. 2 PMI_412]
MSFGFSVGDFIAVGRLVLNLYNACKDAPGEFREINGELSSLHIILCDLAEQALDPTSLLIPLGRMEPVLGRIETLLRDYVREEQAGQKAATVLAAHETDDAVSWKQVEMDLLTEGISQEDFEKHRDRIK